MEYLSSARSIGPKYIDCSQIFPIAALLVRLLSAMEGSVSSFDGEHCYCVLYIQNGSDSFVLALF